LTKTRTDSPLGPAQVALLEISSFPPDKYTRLEALIVDLDFVVAMPRAVRGECPRPNIEAFLRPGLVPVERFGQSYPEVRRDRGPEPRAPLPPEAQRRHRLPTRA
jgi:hypothetical protein